MKNCRTLIAALIGILILASSATGIQVSVSSSAGGFTEVIDAGFNDRVTGSTTIGSDRLSNSIVGEGSLRESHSVSNTAGATAEVGVDIRDAEWYSYSYDLWPGQGHSWKAAKFPQVAAGEDLDVLNASYIEAYADASSSKGHSAGVSTVISDPGNEASLTGYSNLAMTSKNEAFASQTYDWASSPNGYTQADLSADFTQLKSRPLRFREDKVETSIQVDRGYVEGYSDLASASALGVTASQQIDAATGEQIQTGSLASSKSASLFQSLKAEKAKINTQVEGSLTGYNAIARSSEGYVFANQTGHIAGSFIGTAAAGSASKTRSSNYGDKYDFAMQAGKDSSGSYASGNLGYYVDNVSPIANRIQGAVDAAESGDNINVAPGMYFENIKIDKSLTLKGSGAGSDPVTHTIVDGGQNGSVFTIGQIHPEAEVYLQSMAIQNGSGMNTELYPGDFYMAGGGVWNQGTLSLMDTLISTNNADVGGGIFNDAYGTVNLFGGNIAGNNAGFGGGIFSSGTFNQYGGNITGNNATYSGGIDSLGTFNLYGGSITGNNADVGGGIASHGTFNLYDGSITGNNADVGGGILSDGTFNQYGGNITGNNATYSGGIDSLGTFNLYGGSITGNNADVGGGIFNHGIFNLYGGDITGNNADVGGGVLSDGTFNQYGGNISWNNADVGGGIFNDGYGTVNLFGGNIAGNNAKYYGGAIYSAGTLTIDNISPIDGSTISYNVAEKGGGIYNDDSGIVYLYGGSIDHNNATAPAPSGGGIYNMGSIYGDTGIVHDNTPDQIVNGVEWLPEI